MERPGHPRSWPFQLNKIPLPKRLCLQHINQTKLFKINSIDSIPDSQGRYLSINLSIFLYTNLLARQSSSAG